MQIAWCPERKKTVEETTSGGEADAGPTTDVKTKGGEQQLPRRSSSSSEEPESSVSTTSEEDDPLQGEPQKRQLCRRLVRSLYREEWANLVFDKRSRRFFVEEEAPAGNFLWLTTVQTKKVVSQFMECAYYSLMTLRLYGEESRFRALQMCLREQPLQATDVWTACRVRYHGPLGVTKEEIWGLLEERLTETATSEEDHVFEHTVDPQEADGPSTTTRGDRKPPSSSTGAGDVANLETQNDLAESGSTTPVVKEELDRPSGRGGPRNPATVTALCGNRVRRLT